MLILGFIGIALFFTWFSHKRRDILISVVAALIWFSMAMWLFFSGETPFNLEDSYVQILAWVFIILTFVPFLMQMNVEIQHEAKGQSWKTWGAPPSTTTSGYEAYKEKLLARTRGRRRR